LGNASDGLGTTLEASLPLDWALASPYLRHRAIEKACIATGRKERVDSLIAWTAALAGMPGKMMVAVFMTRLRSNELIQAVRDYEDVMILACGGWKSGSMLRVLYELSGGTRWAVLSQAEAQPYEL
jgi:hypothetical protein